MAELKEKATKAVAEKKTAAKVEEKKTTTAKTPAKGKTVKFTNKTVEFLGTGRRKQSIARVRVQYGTGKFIVNGKDINEYFPLGTMILVAKQPLELTNSSEKYDVYVNVHGGGLTGQSGAIRHGLSRALVKVDELLKGDLKKEGYLTRDSRIKERKKYGLKKARKGPQFRKR